MSLPRRPDDLTAVGMDHNDPNIVALFQNQMRIARIAPFPAFGLGGDSGSLVVAKEGLHAVGLYFAGPPAGDYGIAINRHLFKFSF